MNFLFLRANITSDRKMDYKYVIFHIWFISFTAVPCTGFSCYECVYSTMEDSFQQGVNCSDPFDAGKAVGYLKPCSSGICSKAVKRYTTSYELITRGCWENSISCTEHKTNTKTVYEELKCCFQDGCNGVERGCRGYVVLVLTSLIVALFH
ncbi:hypothetical protein LSH36_148g01032 [Paralvinella palmiformis]|uniref:Uncharacterized protein n=1 Tax=Paralvinella palmiformis TaxID=53620 RepID=A0AAD9JV12_9ANNE|nr:hypothetical protein LSH36_148g01032 [Paralvinella palmiformis]